MGLSTAIDGTTRDNELSNTFIPSTTTPSAVADLSVIIPAQVSRICLDRGLAIDKNGVVRWAPNSNSHPRCWSLGRKAFDTSIIFFLEFFMTAISNTGSAVIEMAATDLGMSKELTVLAFTSVYLFAQGIGGLIFSPISESFGGRIMYTASTFVFAIFCLAIAVAPRTLAVVIIGRFITGVMSAMAPIVGCGSIENMWDIASRSFVIHLLIVCSITGLGVGPVMGTYFATSHLGWTWLFFFATIVTACAGLLCIGMRESRPSNVLRAQAKAIAKETGFDGLSTDADIALPTFRMFLRSSLLLPARLLFTEPIVMLISIMIGFVAGLVYLFSEALSIVYLEGFGFTARQNSLVLLALVVGVLFTWLPRIYDVRLRVRQRQRGRGLEPEDKLFGFFVAAPVLAVGLWWFSATVPPLTTISPWVSIASLIFVGFSTVEFAHVLNGYLCDAYAAYAASATAAMSFLRCLLSGAFPLFSRQFFKALGTNHACFILGGLATLFCGVAVLFGRYGRKIRERSAFATKMWLTTSNCQPRSTQNTFVVSDGESLSVVK